MTAAVDLASPPPLDSTKWGTEQKDGQNDKWRKDQSEAKRHKKSPTAVYAPNGGQRADDHVKKQLEHGSALLNSQSCELLDARPGRKSRVFQEPVAAPAFSACSADAFALRAEAFDRDSHICFCALTNSR